MKLNDETLDKKIQKQILKNSAIEFSAAIEELVWMKDISYMEAIEIMSKEKNYEPEYVAKLITGELKGKLMEELQTLNVLKK